ncbi:hypothetical protein ACFV2X_33625 [Streptomyces sp. NPDC059679]|uniref:hypothetical protein n=1 Tax=Streptomyces sp. NPDC059679 TaxID=3346903 RepID=UPI0036C2ED9E
MTAALFGVLGTSAVATAAPASSGEAPAVAAATGRSDACGAKGCGSATVTWGEKKLPNITMSVNDTKCNGKTVGIQLQIEGFGENHWGGPVHWLPSGWTCHDGYKTFPNLHFEAPWKIRSVRAVVYAKNGGGNNPTLYGGNLADNPYT